MINGTSITVVGNIGQDITMRYTPTGNAVATFSVAVPQRRFNRQSGKWDDKGTTWYYVIAWRNLAENVAASLARGNRVIVTGTIEGRAWENGDRSGVAWEITADAIGPDLAFANVDIRRVSRDAAPVPDDPWAGDSPDGSEPDSSGAQSVGTGHVSQPEVQPPADTAPAASASQSASQSAAPATARGRASRSRSGQAASA